MSAEWFEFQTRGQIESLTRQVDGFLNPVGAIQLWAGASDKIPAGWLNCDGSSVLISAYPELHAVIGTAFGSVDGTHFNLPDFGGKFALGVSATNLIGSSGGSKTITTDNMPNHNHPNTSEPTGITIASASTGISANLPEHTHTYNQSNGDNHGLLIDGGSNSNGTTATLTTTPQTTPAIVFTDPQHNHVLTDPSHTHTSGVVGGGADYLQPYTSIFYTICYTAKFPTG
jgi:microcystin-dependent protein